MTSVPGADDHRPGPAAGGLPSYLRDRAGVEPGRRPVILVAAFEGWNDAGDAATDLVDLVCSQSGAEELDGLLDDEVYDYQFTRPVVRRDDEGRGTLEWPRTRVLRAVLSGEGPGVELLVLRGVEPSFRWRSFTQQILDLASAHEVDAVVTLGALLADVPHTRPLPATPSSPLPELREALAARRPTYEGPTGIVGVVTDSAVQAGLPTVSVWVAVPHYVSQSPSPKAQLALAGRLEELLETTLDLGALTDDAAAWERGVDELAGADPDVAAYVEQLEQARDTETLPEASGEAIAREFERYLRRRGGTDD